MTAKQIIDDVIREINGYGDNQYALVKQYEEPKVISNGVIMDPTIIYNEYTNLTLNTEVIKQWSNYGEDDDDFSVRMIKYMLIDAIHHYVEHESNPEYQKELKALQKKYNKQTQ